MKIKLFVIVALLGVCQSLFAHDSIRVSKIVSVYDADTFRVHIYGWPNIVGNNMPIRVKGVDAPEIRGKCALEKEMAVIAKAYTRDLLINAEVVELQNIERGKYFRLLADVSINGEDLTNLLISNGYARPYDGGKREGWCAK